MMNVAVAFVFDATSVPREVRPPGLQIGEHLSQQRGEAPEAPNN